MPLEPPQSHSWPTSAQPNPSPQSESWLQLVSQIGSQSVAGPHDSTPPSAGVTHDVTASGWQRMPAPQSASVVHGFSWQMSAPASSAAFARVGKTIAAMPQTNRVERAWWRIGASCLCATRQQSACPIVLVGFHAPRPDADRRLA